MTQSEALLYVFGIGFCNVIQVSVGPQLVVKLINCCHRWRAGMVGLLYKKVNLSLQNENIIIVLSE